MTRHDTWGPWPRMGGLPDDARPARRWPTEADLVRMGGQIELPAGKGQRGRVIDLPGDVPRIYVMTVEVTQVGSWAGSTIVIEASAGVGRVSTTLQPITAVSAPGGLQTFIGALSAQSLRVDARLDWDVADQGVWTVRVLAAPFFW